MPDPVTQTTTAPETPAAAPDLTPQVHTTPPPQVQTARADKVDAPPAAPARGEDGKFQSAKDTPAETPKDPVAALLTQLKGLPVAQVDALLDAIERETGNSPPQSEDGDVQVTESSESRPAGPVRYSEVEPGMQKAIAAVHNHMMEQSVNQAIDSDKELSYNMKALGPKVRESVTAFVKDAMEKMIESEGDRFDYNWGRIAQKAFAQARPRIEPFFERPTPRAGMGPGPGQPYMTRELQEPKRVPAYADAEDYSTYLQQKIAYNLAQAERETQSQVPGL